MSDTEEPLPPPAAVFSDFVSKPTKSSKRSREVIDPRKVDASPAAQLAGRLRMKSYTRADYVPYYKASDNIYGTASGVDDRPDLNDLACIAQMRIGCVWMATNEVAGDAVRNWHGFVDPDRPDKPIKNEKTKAILEFAAKTDLKNATQQWLRYERVFGTSFLVKYWTNNDTNRDKNNPNSMSNPPPKRPPRKFRAFSPRFMTPINLNKSNELDYNEKLWKFSGGLFAKYAIHQDRIDVLSTRPEEGHWRGLSICEPVWIPLMGYFNNFVYIVKAFRKWGESVPVMYSGDKIPESDEIDDILDLMEQYQANWKWALGKDDKMEFIQTQIGRGVGEAMEQYKEDISSCWRIPLNQLFGRSVGGGLAGAGALVSKEDYLQNISNIEMSISDNLLSIYTDAGFEVEQWDLYWNMAVKKTDEQRLREEGMEQQNIILKEQAKQQKIQTKMLKLQLEQSQWGQLTPEEERPPTEGAPGEEEEEYEVEESEQAEPKLTDFNKRFWGSIRIDNHINFPYKDPDSITYFGGESQSKNY